MSAPNLLDLMGDKGQAPREVSADTPAPQQNKTEHVELELVLHYDNDVRGAIFVSTDGNEGKAVWLPKSQIQYADAGRRAPSTTTEGKPMVDGLPVIIANVPEWLARGRGLI